jgi:hypothetical protein
MQTPTQMTRRFTHNCTEQVLPVRHLGLLLLLLFIGSTSALRAQVLYGSILGNVTDSSGGVVPGAVVQVRNIAANTTQQSVSDSSGTFRVVDLKPGVYTVTIQAKSFAKVETSGVVLQANTSIRLDTQLRPEAVGQNVTVSGTAPVLQTDQASISAELDSSQLQQLPAGPNAGMRNFQGVYTIVPGFSPPVASHSEASNPGDTLATNVNGASDSNNNTRIDGVSDIYPWIPDVAAYAPSVEAIQAVNIVTNSFDAEQGIAGGVVVNVTTKSGSNRFHGNAWEYNTISALEARNYFLPVTTPHVPKYVLNQFGANYGGPILKNKAFFFANWERTRRSQAVNGFQTVPTAAMIMGNFQGTGTIIYDPTTGNADGTGRTPFMNNMIPTNRISYAAQQLITLLPPANPAITSLSNNYFASASAEYTRDNIDSRVDYTISPKATVFGRYGVQKGSLFDPQALGKAGGNTLDGGQPGTAPSLVQSIGLGGTYAFTSALLFDANFGYLRQGLSAKNVDLGQNYGLNFLNIPGTNGPSPLQGGFPSFAINGLSSLGNPNVSNPFQFRDNTYTAASNLTWNKHTHALRFGFEYQHYAINHFQPQNSYGPRGGFNFTGGLTALKGGASPNGYNGWADFLLGLPQAFGKDTQFYNPATLRESVWAVYARDQWQLMRQLTLTYGLRYEVYPIATRDHSGIGVLDETTGLVNIGGVNGIPKSAGINDGKGVVGPRIGLAYRLNEKTVIRAGYGISVNPDNYRNMTTAYPAIISQSFSGANAYSAAGSTVTGIPAPVLPDLSSGSVLLPTSLTTTTMPKNYRRGYIESYNLAVQRDLGKGYTLQAAYVGTHAVREVVGLNGNAAAPGTGNAGRALYPTLGLIGTIYQETPMGTAKYNSLQTTAKHRFGDGGTVGVNYTFSKAIDDYGDNSQIGPYVSYLPDYYRNRGLASFDRKHNFQIYENYNLPFGKGHAMLSSGIGSLLAGGWSIDSILSRDSGTPFTVSASATSLNAPGNSQFANQLVSKVRILGGHDSMHPYFDPTAFAPVTTATFGTAPYNGLRGPGFFNLNTSLARGFNFTERFGIQFRAEAFNLTNTPAFANPGANVSSESTSNGVVSYNGYSIISSASNQRVLRLSARVSF